MKYCNMYTEVLRLNIYIIEFNKTHSNDITVKQSNWMDRYIV